MYFVDRELIEAKLKFLESQLELYESQNTWESQIEKTALERICHMSIETILDVGNAMIDGFIMRDPGSYEDIIEILLDEKVIDDSAASGLKKVVQLRKTLVQDYLQVNHKDIEHILTTYQNSLSSFPTRVRTYIQNELGPVSAFKPLKS